MPQTGDLPNYSNVVQYGICAGVKNATMLQLGYVYTYAFYIDMGISQTIYNTRYIYKRDLLQDNTLRVYQLI